MLRFPESIATRLALGYGLLVAATVSLLCLMFYGATIVVLENELGERLVSLSQRLAESYRERPEEELVQAIDRQLQDGRDSDNEIFMVLSASGARLAGNLREWTGAREPLDELLTHNVQRGGQQVGVRYIVQQIDAGRLLVVGSDLRPQDAIRQLVLQALGAGVVAALLLTVAGAAYFRRQLEARIGQIRRAARDIEQGDLGRRIPIAGNDEFERLGMDINQMLDRIEQLMNGVRHVSNSIAHDLRTPLNRVRAQLEESLRGESSVAGLRESAQAAIDDIDALVQLFNKLLRIAEVESGMRARFLAVVSPNDIVRDMVELYDAIAEDHGIALVVVAQEARSTRGDHDLLASALASLLDNALKYAAGGTRVEVGAYDRGDQVHIEVRDYGPGIAEADLPLVVERFYRADYSRSQPGSGLGLSIVSAIATLHSGTLLLENANPGLRAALVLPLQPVGADNLSNS